MSTSRAVTATPGVDEDEFRTEVALNTDIGGLLGLLECPLCGGALEEDGDGFRCTRGGHEFGGRWNVPVLTTDHRTDEPSLLARLQYAVLGSPRVYDFHQRHGGGRPIAARVAAALGDVGTSTLLDVGAGTGMVASLISGQTRYVWLDNDLLKLRGFLAKSVDSMAVLADAGRLPFGAETVDVTVMVEVSHHLPDDALKSCFDEIARVTRDRFVFVDGLRGTSLRSRILWQLDLGRFPRTERDVVAALGAAFEVIEVDRFRVNHDHIVCTCIPRR